MRLRQQDEKPGSVVTFADVRYATTGIDVTGLPNNTPLTGTAGRIKQGMTHPQPHSSWVICWRSIEIQSVLLVT